jgi:glycosyltransferase involved in cell wall biosynthesis
MPRISILLPTFNASAFIAETIGSILSQTEGDFELLVLDDLSSDSTADIVRALDDPRIRLHVNPVNLGTPTNINIGLALARGTYVARMDHDDIAAPDRLRLQATFLDQHAEVVLLGGQIEHFQDEVGRSSLPLDDAGIKAQLLVGFNYIANPTTMFRTQFIHRHGIRFDPNLYVVDDLGFIFDCVEAGGALANLPQVLLRYRIHEAMTSRNLDASRLYRSKSRLFRRILPTYFPGISGAEGERLLDLYQLHDRAPSDMPSLKDLFHATGRAISRVSDRLGQDPALTAQAFAGLLTRRADYLINDAGRLTLEAYREVLEPIYLQALNQGG